MAGLYLFNYSVRVGRTCSSSWGLGLHQGLPCSKAWRVLKRFSTQLQDTVWDLMILSLLKEITWTRPYPKHTSWTAIPKYRVGGRKCSSEGNSYLILYYLLNQLEKKMFTIQNGLKQLGSKLARVFYWSLGRIFHPRVLSFLRWACSSWEVKVLT